MVDGTKKTARPSCGVLFDGCSKTPSDLKLLVPRAPKGKIGDVWVFGIKERANAGTGL
jgi:hypothetical protein